MMTADAADKKNTFKVAFLTAASIFVMGYLNALALNTTDLGTMISAQSGNVIWIGLNAAGAYWGPFIENLGLLFGFAGGAAFAMLTQNIFKNKVGQFFYNWTVFIVPILAYPFVLQYIVPAWFSYIILGFACGAVLGFFRKMYHLEINNAMATGSARFLGLELVNTVKKNPNAAKSLLIFLICVLAFAAGSFLYGMMLRVDYNIVNNVSLTLGNPDVAYYAASRLNNLAIGGFAYITAPVGNIARIVAFIVICIIPFFFCPTPSKKTA